MFALYNKVQYHKWHGLYILEALPQTRGVFVRDRRGIWGSRDLACTGCPTRGENDDADRGRSELARAVGGPARGESWRQSFEAMIL